MVGQVNLNWDWEMRRIQSCEEYWGWGFGGVSQLMRLACAEALGQDRICYLRNWKKSVRMEPRGQEIKLERFLRIDLGPSRQRGFRRGTTRPPLPPIPTANWTRFPVTGNIGPTRCEQARFQSQLTFTAVSPICQPLWLNEKAFAVSFAGYISSSVN